MGGPRLLAAVALVHAEHVAGAGIEYSVNELRLDTAPTTPNGGRSLSFNRTYAGHAMHSDWRERCSVSLSPMNTDGPCGDGEP